MRVTTGKIVVWIALAGCLLGAGGCHKPSAPPDPGLAHEDFGSGIQLLSDAAAARSQADSTQALIIKAVTASEMAQVVPSASAEQDLLLAVTGPPPAGAQGAPADCVTELRCYVALSEKSKATLLGQPLSGMTAQQAEGLLGPAFIRTVSGDATHLEFHFADKVQPQLKLALMLSFHPDPEGCFAARLWLIGPMKKF